MCYMEELKKCNILKKINPLEGLKVFVKQSQACKNLFIYVVFLPFIDILYMKQFEIVLCMRECINIHQILYGDL